MRCLLAVLLVFNIAGTAVASLTGSTSDTVKAPRTGTPSGPNPGIRINGDTIDDPFVLPGLGTVTGTTTGFSHDYDEMCPYGGGYGPDVVYAYAPAAGLETITLDLCFSSYDTKMYVYDNVYTHGNPYACNDDFNFSPPCLMYTSRIERMPVTTGHTYYIVIDAYADESGPYQLDVTEGGIVGACCAVGGDCTISEESQCAGIWQGADTNCNPNLCPPPPTGACCDQATGDCMVTIQAACEFDWLGADVPCNGVTCLSPVPTERTSWGQIKSLYR